MKNNQFWHAGVKHPYLLSWWTAQWGQINNTRKTHFAGGKETRQLLSVRRDFMYGCFVISFKFPNIGGIVMAELLSNLKYKLTLSAKGNLEKETRQIHHYNFSFSCVTPSEISVKTLWRTQPERGHLPAKERRLKGNWTFCLVLVFLSCKIKEEFMLKTQEKIIHTNSLESERWFFIFFLEISLDFFFLLINLQG